MGEPWIKLYRKFTEWEWYQDVNCKVVFLHLLLTANWKPKKWQGRVIEVGELVTSYPALAEDVCLTLRQVRTALDKLINSGVIEKKPTNKFTQIKICNYEKYQQTNDRVETVVTQGAETLNSGEDDRQMTDKCQTDDRQMTAPKELKKDRNIEYKDYSGSGSIYNINNIYSEPAAASAEVQSVFKTYQENIGVLTPRIAEILTERIAAQGAALVSLAVVEAAECNARSIRYIERILISWQEAGIKTAGDVTLRNAERSQKKAEKASGIPGNVARSQFRNYPESFGISEDEKAVIDRMMEEYDGG